MRQRLYPIPISRHLHHPRISTHLPRSIIFQHPLVRPWPLVRDSLLSARSVLLGSSDQWQLHLVQHFPVNDQIIKLVNENTFLIYALSRSQSRVLNSENESRRVSRIMFFDTMKRYHEKLLCTEYRFSIFITLDCYECSGLTAWIVDQRLSRGLRIVPFDVV